MAINNVVKKIEKGRAKLGLSDDEQVLAACMTDPKAVGAMIGGLAGAAMQAAAEKKYREASADGSMASMWPKGRHLMAITSKRVIVCKMSAMSGKPTEVVAGWPHGDIAVFDIEKKATGYPFAITFTDGTVAGSEGAKGTGADQLGEVAGSIWASNTP